MSLRIRLKKPVKNNFTHNYLRMADILCTAKEPHTKAAAEFIPHLHMAIAVKIVRTLPEIESNTPLKDRSVYLLTDIFKYAAITYYHLPGITILSDAAFDRLHRFICENIENFRERGITKNMLPLSFVDSATAMMVAPTAYSDLHVLRSILSLRNQDTKDIVEAIYNLKIYRPKLRLRLR